MDIHQATVAYDKWLGKRVDIVKADLKLKHTDMGEDEFSFFRATFYRWMQHWPEKCADLTHSPEVRACGDVHLENFGTWRDAEGRLCWGLNDFDEAYVLPYTQDLVRLAASASLIHFGVGPSDCCDTILDGYVDGLKKGGNPMILADRHVWLRQAAINEFRDPVKFWSKILACKPWKREVPGSLRRSVPQGASNVRFLHRIGGMGSLGRPRIVAVADWCGGLVAREAKATAPSACVFASGSKDSRSYGQELADRAIRAADPYYRITDRWVLRRLSPDCCRIELASLEQVRDQKRLLRAMGSEIANLHLATRKAVPAIMRDLKRLPPGWLTAHADRMAGAIRTDFQEWRKR